MCPGDRTNSGFRNLSTDQLRELLEVLEGADSVELKLTVPDGDQRSAVAALEMDPLEAEIRQVFFLDTDDLLLERHGVIARARRTRDGDDSVIKLRPVVPGDLPATSGSCPASGWRSTRCPVASSARPASRRTSAPAR